MTTTERRCGDCNACCRIMAVREIDKPRLVRCPHLAGRGCGVYAERPTSCAAFKCGWLSGFGAGKDRPDRLGVMLRVEADCRALIEAGGGIPKPSDGALIAEEVYGGSFTQPRWKAHREGLVAQGCVILQIDAATGRATLFGPRHREGYDVKWYERG
jgi:hypothetical protein